jgi:hypothetical protein
MNSAEELLLHRSWSYLLDVGDDLEALVEEGDEATIESAVELGFAQFAAINRLLKACLDVGDLETFARVEQRWREILEELWLPDEWPIGSTVESDDQANVPDLRELVRFRQILCFGLAMWAVHIVAADNDRTMVERAAAALRQLAGRFGDIEGLLDLFEAATDREEHDSVPWSEWFLAELPERQAHFIPTRQELLTTALLLAVPLITPDEPPKLLPREWFAWRKEEIDRTLDRLASEQDKWLPTVAPIMRPSTESVRRDDLDARESAPEPPAQQWQRRVRRLGTLLDRGREEQEERERAVLRTTELDPDRVAQFRDETLRATREARMLHATFRLHGSIRDHSERPAGARALVSRSWMPKSLFTRDSRVVGLDMAARQLSRVTRAAEGDQLREVLPSDHPRSTSGSISELVAVTIRDMRNENLHPSLLLLPIGFELHRALGLQAFGNRPTVHPLVPAAYGTRFDGVFDDVPAASLPQVPRELMWVIDLSAAATMHEWPSDENSGVRFELQEFSEAGAVALLAEHPEVADPEATREQAIADLQERVLLSLHLCWAIAPGRPGAAIPIEIPPELRRASS